MLAWDAPRRCSPGRRTARHGRGDAQLSTTITGAVTPGPPHAYDGVQVRRRRARPRWDPAHLRSAPLAAPHRVPLGTQRDGRAGTASTPTRRSGRRRHGVLRRERPACSTSRINQGAVYAIDATGAATVCRHRPTVRMHGYDTRPVVRRGGHGERRDAATGPWTSLAPGSGGTSREPRDGPPSAGSVTPKPVCAP